MRPHGRPTHRPQRMADLIREEIASFLVNGIKNPLIGFVTVTRVKMTDDLQIARVYYTAYGSDQEKRHTHMGLLDSLKQIRSHLAKTVRTRRVPNLEFYVDEGLDHSYRIQELLGSLQPTDEKH